MKTLGMTEVLIGSNLPNPTKEDLKRQDFIAIWEAIKTWDINVPNAFGGYCKATGSHVKAILNALKKPLEEIQTLRDINPDSTEGKLIIATLARLSCQPDYSNQTPDDILRQMVEVAKNF